VQQRKEKAMAAAKAVNGTVLLPIFAPSEQTYPADLEPVTPIKARNGDLSDKQRAAIAQMKMFTDFNDLATKSLLGEGGVERQVTTIVNSLVVSNQKQIEIKQQHERDEKLEQQSVQRKAVKI
jgi:putative DNA primase/helicase